MIHMIHMILQWYVFTLITYYYYYLYNSNQIILITVDNFNLKYVKNKEKTYNESIIQKLGFFEMITGPNSNVFLLE